jgi:hypothetical protein
VTPCRLVIVPDVSTDIKNLIVSVRQSTMNWTWWNITILRNVDKYLPVCTACPSQKAEMFSNTAVITWNLLTCYNYVYLCHSPVECEVNLWQIISSGALCLAPCVRLPSELVPVSWYTSPGFSSCPSLNHRSCGVGNPTTLHSKDTKPSSVRTAFKLSKKRGFR